MQPKGGAVKVGMLVILVNLGLTAASAYAACGVNMSCDLPPRCNEPVCFTNDVNKQQYEKANNCVVQNKCDYAVASVKQEFNKIPASNPTYGFYRNQVCIADKSCASKAMLDNAKWLDNVVSDFITPLVMQEGKWKSIKAKCLTYRNFAGLNCQDDMAKYHIKEDLQASVNKNGCGTEKDWDKIGAWLKTCVDTGVKEDVVFGFESAGGWVASVILAWNRDAVRSACVTDRKARGLSIEGK